jgi:hypothetical protein
MIQLILGIVAGILLERALHLCDKAKPLVVALLTKVKPMLVALITKAKAWIIAKISKKKAA